jgi:hydrogenase nickel incorporation protein HypB
MTNTKVTIVEKIFEANDQLANGIRHVLDSAGIFSINIMASPGSGKTSLILQTLKRLPEDIQAAVIEGDTAPVTID